MEHNFATPDPAYAIPYRLSPNHYWKVDGILPATFDAKATLTYDGRTTAFSGNFWLDNNLVTTFEDSLVLLYRPNPSMNWGLYPYYTKNMQANNNDKRGIITIDSLQLGEYVFAMMDYASGIQNYSFSSTANSLKVFPNPAKDIVMVDFVASGINLSDNSLLVITDVSGKIIHREKLNQQQTIAINTSTFSNGLYFVSIKTKEGLVAKNRFIVAH
ncbi:MAG: T9SS type A sorting domain-containing protein [Bacteroidetes bacterium]|nr:T9SS type A sorting domain-containing protein [Bacteroidota bacterium]